MIAIEAGLPGWVLQEMVPELTLAMSAV